MVKFCELDFKNNASLLPITDFSAENVHAQEKALWLKKLLSKIHLTSSFCKVLLKLVKPRLLQEQGNLIKISEN
jgi:hypothetical protein